MKAFTLIELLFVIIIIGILSAAVMNGTRPMEPGAKQTTTKPIKETTWN